MWFVNIPSGHIASVEFDVAFHDVDLGGVVWHGHYLKYFEWARTELMRSLGLDIGQLLELGVRVVVAESRCRHHRPLRYGERAVVLAWLETVQPAVTVRYRIERGGALITDGRTTLVTVGPHEDRLVAIPGVALQRLMARPRTGDLS